MAVNMTEWHSKRGPISKIRPLDGCGRDGVLLAVERWYDFPEFGGYLGNVGLCWRAARKGKWDRACQKIQFIALF